MDVQAPTMTPVDAPEELPRETAGVRVEPLDEPVLVCVGVGVLVIVVVPSGDADIVVLVGETGCGVGSGVAAVGVALDWGVFEDV